MFKLKTSKCTLFDGSIVEDNWFGKNDCNTCNCKGSKLSCTKMFCIKKPNQISILQYGSFDSYKNHQQWVKSIECYSSLHKYSLKRLLFNIDANISSIFKGPSRDLRYFRAKPRILGLELNKLIKDKSSDTLVYIDIDVMVIDYERSITDIFHLLNERYGNGCDVVVQLMHRREKMNRLRAKSSINAGILFFKATQWSLNFLQSWSNITETSGISDDQIALFNLILHHAAIHSDQVYNNECYFFSNSNFESKKKKLSKWAIYYNNISKLYDCFHQHLVRLGYDDTLYNRFGSLCFLRLDKEGERIHHQNQAILNGSSTPSNHAQYLYDQGSLFFHGHDPHVANIIESNIINSYQSNDYNRCIKKDFNASKLNLEEYSLPKKVINYPLKLK